MSGKAKVGPWRLVLIGLAAKESCARGGVPVKIVKEGRHD